MRVQLNGTRWRPTLMVFLLAIILCVQAGCFGPLRGTIALREAQVEFLLASRETLKQYKTEWQSTGIENLIPPESPQDKYEQVIHTVDTRVLPNVDRDEFKVAAYTLKSYALWKSGKGKDAKITAEEGVDLYQRSGLTAYRRNYGMLLILPGLVDYSEAYRMYQSKLKEQSRSDISAEEAHQITGAMDAALKEIDTINSKIEVKEPIAIFANFLQLRIIRNILDVWGKVPASDVKAAAACDWWCKGETILKTKFPKEHFLEKDIVVELVGEINSFKQPGCACPSN
jgi:hypothetical protein